MFIESQQVLKEMECQTIGEIYVNGNNWYVRLCTMIKSTFLHPFKLIKVGWDNGLVKDTSKFVVISGATMLVMSLFFKNLDIEVSSSNLNYITFVAVGFALILTLFPLPSSLSDNNIKKEHIIRAAKLIENKGIRTEEGVDILRKNTKMFEQAVLKRINALRAGLLLLWTYLFYKFNNYLEMETSFRQQEVSTLIGMGLLILIYFIVLDSYKKANTIIFRGIEFGANEYSYNLLQKDIRSRKNTYLNMKSLNKIYKTW